LIPSLTSVNCIGVLFPETPNTPQAFNRPDLKILSLELGKIAVFLP
jgi:hypothetical protein